MNVVGSPWKPLVATMSSRFDSIFFLGLIACFLIILLVIAFAALFTWINWTPLRLQRSPTSLVVGLALTIFVITMLLLLPVSLPQLIGTIGLLCIFFLLLLVNVTNLSIVGIQANIPLISILLAISGLFSFFSLNDDHAVRTVDCTSACLEAKAGVYDRFKQWLNARPDIDRFPDEYPVYIVAAEGGGYMLHTNPEFSSHA